MRYHNDSTTAIRRPLRGGNYFRDSRVSPLLNVCIMLTLLVMGCAPRAAEKENKMAKVKVIGRFHGAVADNRKVCTELSYQKRWPTTCCRPIKFFRDGVGYCGIHDPEHQAEMQRKRDLNSRAT